MTIRHEQPGNEESREPTAEYASETFVRPEHYFGSVEETVSYINGLSERLAADTQLSPEQREQAQARIEAMHEAVGRLTVGVFTRAASDHASQRFEDMLHQQQADSTEQ